MAAPTGCLRRCLLALCLFLHLADSCVPHSIQAQVPVKINPGIVITRVPLGSCRGNGLRLSSGDPRFAVRRDGTVISAVATTVTERKWFNVWVSEGGGQARRVELQLTPDPEELRLHLLPTQKDPWDQARKRSKRRWSPLPFNIIENDLPPFPKDLELVGSDSSVNYSVYYTIQGPGVTLPPLNLFSVDPNTGMVRVHYAVDREQYPQFVFKAQVFDKKSTKETDRALYITVLVLDLNDNAPTFSGSLAFHVEEQSAPGTEVGAVVATDRDQEGTPHTKIKFSLLSMNQFFDIHHKSGMISTKMFNLDRETQATIPIVVEIRDMDGAKIGLFSTATATVSLLDINDNAPTFRETTYKATIEENKSNVLLLKIPVDDKDEERTKNWNAKFVIVEGNENGNFRVDTDPKTNEGLLYVVKPLDYEKGRVVMLNVSAQNEAPLVRAQGSWHSIPVELSVGDVDEGPEFIPPRKVIRVKENTPIGTVIGTHVAMDPETKSSAGIKYYKLSEPGSWVSVVESTGELKVANTIDLESPLVTNAMYNFTVKAVDSRSKSGMGSVTLLIDDANDHAPELIDQVLVMCEEEGKRGSVVLRAHDADQPPYAAPFHFQLEKEEAKAKWRLRDAENTSVVLEAVVDLPRVTHDVVIRVMDLQNNGNVQTVKVRVCVCVSGECVLSRSSASMGVWGVLAMLLALAVLLLLCILFVFACTTKRDKMYIDDSSGGMLLKSNTEAPGEEVNSDLFLVPPLGGGDVVDTSANGTGILDQNENASNALTVQQTMAQQAVYQSSRQEFTTMQNQSSFYTSGFHRGASYADRSPNYSDSMYRRQAPLSTVNTWETNRIYLDQKLDYFGGNSEERYAADLPRTYRYEGEGSAAGSVGCCSDLGDLDGLDFLDSLGPKFKTLANICLDRD